MYQWELNACFYSLCAQETVQVIMDAREQLNRQNDERMASLKSQIRLSGSTGPKSSHKLSASPLLSSTRHDTSPPGISSRNRGGCGHHSPSVSTPNPGLDQHVLNSSPHPYHRGYHYPDGEASETGSRLSSGSRATSASQRHIDRRSRGDSRVSLKSSPSMDIIFLSARLFLVTTR